ncbi:MAG: LysM peptidoglycan-binding domain-containing protein [Chloroflexi bacterium]|nr:LysM peptidoglycan-binding domain-containing protein [Chloroflexota bacterium]
MAIPTFIIPSATLPLPNLTPLPGWEGTATPVSPTPATPTEAVPPTCSPPKGWEQIIIQPGDRLDDLAQARGTSVERLMDANCLDSTDLLPDTVLFIPPLKPTHTATQPAKENKSDVKVVSTHTPVPIQPIPCGAPHGWVPYIVQSGDNLYRLGQKFHTSVYELQVANCLGGSTLIAVGQRLSVPNVATNTPSPTNAEPPPPKPKKTTPAPTADLSATYAAQTAQAARQLTSQAAEQQTAQAKREIQETDQASQQLTAQAEQQAQQQTAQAVKDAQETAQAAQQQTADAASTAQSPTLTAEAPPPSGNSLPPSGEPAWMVNWLEAFKKWLFGPPPTALSASFII